MLVHNFSDVDSCSLWQPLFNALLFELKINCCIEIFSSCFMSPSGIFAIDDAISFQNIWSSVLAFSFSAPSDNTIHNVLDKNSCWVTLLLLGRFGEFLGVEAVTVLISIKPEPQLLRFKLLVDWWGLKKTDYRETRPCWFFNFISATTTFVFRRQVFSSRLPIICP